jgi:bifunctional UDP-N-acetylglucosamine pyrophosphorylase/glucosamine-1-phosphate N-acetyltransferase
MSLSIVVLAAGKGTRMKSSLPKVLHKISGKPMLFHILDEASKLSDDITVVLSHQFDKVKEELLKEYPNVKIHKQNIDEFPGTGGALKGLEFSNDKVLILNGDMPLITKESLEKLSNSQAPLAMTVLNLDNPSGYGRVIIENSNVKKIVEEKDANEEEKAVTTVNAGVYAVDSKLLNEFIPKLENNNAQKEYYLTDIVQMAVEKSLQIEPIEVDEDEFMGVNSKYHLSIAEEFMQKRIKQALMETGVIMRLPDTIYIDSRASFEGECIIENGVSIEGACQLKNAHIKANSIIEDSLIENSDIGPLAHIRPKSVIIDTHIGNFVEVKKSTLKGVKAGHLSYLGDSEIDEGTNIGAGVITCNYDGINKYQTKIGKNVFVGSDSQLVAPVTLSDNTMIAAGSTITNDVPEGSLAISRVKQKIIPGFFHKFFKKKQEC